MKENKTRVLVECALMIALSTALSFVPLFEMPMGGSVTLCSMAPLVIISFRHGAKWGLLTAGVHGLIQMIFGLKNVMYATTILAVAGCILLDYIIAFAVMGLSCMFAFRRDTDSQAVITGAAVAGLLRLGCSFLSGIIIWSGYAPEGTPVWIYSLQYNASYMVPEIIITAISAAVALKVINKRFPTA